MGVPLKAAHGEVFTPFCTFLSTRPEARCQSICSNSAQAEKPSVLSLFFHVELCRFSSVAQCTCATLSQRAASKIQNGHSNTTESWAILKCNATCQTEAKWRPYRCRTSGFASRLYCCSVAPHTYDTCGVECTSRMKSGLQCWDARCHAGLPLKVAPAWVLPK